MECTTFAGKIEDYFPPVKPPVAHSDSEEPTQRVIYVTRGGLAIVAYVDASGKELGHA